MRVFIAHTIPSAIQNELADLQNLLRSSNARITWTLPANIHLTLKFLGEIDEKSLDPVIESSKRAARQGKSILPESRCSRRFSE